MGTNFTEIIAEMTTHRESQNAEASNRIPSLSNSLSSTDRNDVLASALKAPPNADVSNGHPSLMPTAEKLSFASYQEELRSGEVGKIAKFVKKLSRMMNDARVGVCEWTASGEAIILFKGKDFERLLFEHFHGKNFNSFVRQLHTYGFRQQKIRGKENMYTFSHPKFTRGQPELLPLIKRRTMKRKAGLKPQAAIIAASPAVATQLLPLEPKINLCDEIALAWRSCVEMNKRVAEIKHVTRTIEDNLVVAQASVDSVLRNLRHLPIWHKLSKFQIEIFENERRHRNSVLMQHNASLVAEARGDAEVASFCNGDSTAEPSERDRKRMRSSAIAATDAKFATNGGTVDDDDSARTLALC